MDAKKITPKKKKPSKYCELLGQRVRHLRIEKGFTSVERFAYTKNLDRTQMGRLERGANVQFDTLVPVILALGITLEDFFKEGFEELYTKKKGYVARRNP